jgi:NTE family protein
MDEFDTIVLSGGGVKGIALLGAMQYLVDNDVLKKTDTYVATSIGAMIAYLVAIGYTPVEIMVYISTSRILEELAEIDVSHILAGKGALDFERVARHVRRMTRTRLDVETLSLREVWTRFKKRLYVVTFNYTARKMEVLGPDTHPDLDCFTAIKLSATLPLVFNRASHGGSEYIDGGIVNNFPMDVGEQVGKRVLGLRILEKTGTDKNLLEYIYTLFFIPITLRTNEIVRNSRSTVFEIEVNECRVYRFFLAVKDRFNMFSDGYQSAKQNSEGIVQCF